LASVFSIVASAEEVRAPNSIAREPGKAGLRRYPTTENCTKKRLPKQYLSKQLA